MLTAEANSLTLCLSVTSIAHQTSSFRHLDIVRAVLSGHTVALMCKSCDYNIPEVHKNLPFHLEKGLATRDLPASSLMK